METGKISVIVPVYNASRYIDDCISSVKQQIYGNWELILIDNGSEDDSLALCQKASEGDLRIRVFQERINTGVSIARNLGMEKARGEYFTFLDADDRLKPEALERLLVLLTASGADFAVGGFERWTDRRSEGSQRTVDKIAEQKEAQPSYQAYDSKAYLENCLLNGNTHCWGVLYRAKIREKAEFIQGLSIGEDVLFLLEAGLQSDQIAVTKEELYQYYMNAAGAMEKPFTPSYMDQILCWEKVRERVEAVAPRLLTKAESILLVSTLLVVGKLARLPGTEKRKYRMEEGRCREVVRQYAGKKEVLSLLPEGYGWKVRLYRYWPQLYLLLYGGMIDVRKKVRYYIRERR